MDDTSGFLYINYVGMAGCLKYKRLLCIHLFYKVGFFGFFGFFFLFSFSDILAAGDYWVKLLRTLQKNWGRLVLYAEGHGRQHELLGTLCDMP